ncbi:MULTISPECIES: 5-(carboxyamino)imidazole ribonucleotide mutase [Dethiosulfovibrio]|uniref:N5-carboxyaminoimidazole ribonucleotide mutase n=2 Tax=Dethiosulfovibrio TaxID=47054 RepID=A0ABS9EL26_9BACT|nr:MULTISPECIES: 5-(carboxyamino)imidazole ribonucleotide mutase [Dethiosulfovibrio]MCF4113442.1 5-(carboxyamino)imidazole ribonucleotide mutase [Dethiosulfovibrio russensis]MCF4141912.1 5-(carboxyamino)imidazole ribonucleotide mutase [Dethiosulfovibrio marinus]MCF4144067.1 5-(carboxyamino)imidazole ribonucleotide mutase [Dethiosulfovibrio acidaminovorans]
MTKAKIGIVLGSASDKAIAKKAGDMLDKLQIPYEVTVASAHRTPEDAAAYAANGEKRGLMAIIAVAGLSAALPGVLAAHTSLPVIGVPVSAGTVGGLDALYSVAQMPPGVPVASVGIDGGANAALLAARIVALLDEKVRQNLEDLRVEQAEKVRKSRSTLELPEVPEEAFK